MGVKALGYASQFLDGSDPNYPMINGSFPGIGGGFGGQGGDASLTLSNLSMGSNSILNSDQLLVAGGDGGVGGFGGQGSSGGVTTEGGFDGSSGQPGSVGSGGSGGNGGSASASIGNLSTQKGDALTVVGGNGGAGGNLSGNLTGEPAGAGGNGGSAALTLGGAAFLDGGLFTVQAGNGGTGGISGNTTYGGNGGLGGNAWVSFGTLTLSGGSTLSILGGSGGNGVGGGSGGSAAPGGGAVTQFFYDINGNPQTLVLGGLAALNAGSVAARLHAAKSVPPIHDITTDTQNPPQFVAVLALRRGAMNSSEYGGEKIAEQQRKAFPDIQPLDFKEPAYQVFAKCLESAKEMGWAIVDADESKGRLEATDRTFWFGFKDDIVVRVKAKGLKTRVDIRSVSRVGVGDVGTNAQRIRKFTKILQAKAG